MTGAARHLSPAGRGGRPSRTILTPSPDLRSTSPHRGEVGSLSGAVAGTRSLRDVI
ncbi:hypothetical protein C8P69_103438 [Phreatobacter oligotrophus]|uniref:Uncharacterized protein n=1 Tax=Phreatobacter oligotrophus TaxID=1122261 RepID=A0A2T4ZF28_9HYPH|nr:hypothetical protein C8P69_103438 [Phreatobacter oligotrophus]